MDKASLPIFAAIGGVVFPALVFLYFNYSDPVFVQGWAIPAATDIAFALGILALVGSRAPVSLKKDLSLVALAYGGLGVLGLIILNRMGTMRITPYALIGLFVWACVLKSGVHRRALHGHRFTALPV